MCITIKEAVFLISYDCTFYFTQVSEKHLGHKSNNGSTVQTMQNHKFIGPVKPQLVKPVEKFGFKPLACKFEISISLANCLL